MVLGIREWKKNFFKKFVVAPGHTGRKRGRERERKQKWREKRGGGEGKREIVKVLRNEIELWDEVNQWMKKKVVVSFLTYDEGCASLSRET